MYREREIYTYIIYTHICLHYTYHNHEHCYVVMSTIALNVASRVRALGSTAGRWIVKCRVSHARHVAINHRAV